MISEIYDEMDIHNDNSFSKEELFKHLRDTQITPVKNKDSMDNRLIEVDDNSDSDIEDE